MEFADFHADFQTALTALMVLDRQRALPQAGKMRRKTPGEPSAWTMA
jgi:hypothetical protein